MLNLNRQRWSVRARSWAAAVACTASVSLAASITPAVAQEGSSASSLVSAISDAQSTIDRLNLEMGALREAVNKAIVDYGDARSAAEQARRGAEEAREALKNSQSAVETAQDELDEVSRTTYRNGGSGNSIAPLDSGDAVKDSLERDAYLQKQRDEKQNTLNALEGERTAKANADSLLRLAVQLAEERENQAAAAEESANELLTENQEALLEKSDELVEAQNELVEAQEALEEVRPGAAATAESTESTESTEATGATAPSESATGSSTDDKAETDAESTTSEQAAAEEPSEEQEAHSGEDSAEQPANQYFSDTRSLNGEADSAEESGEDFAADNDAASELSSQAVTAISEMATEKAEESILDREIPVPTLQQIEEAVDTVMSTQGSFDESSQSDLASVASVVAPTLVVLATQVSNADLAQGSSSISGAEQDDVSDETDSSDSTDTADASETADSTDTPASGLPSTANTVETDTADLDTVLPEIQTAEEVTEAATELVSDSSRAAKIETVIARAESQLGVPYAWGGGDANGPTKGIRDGGVADAHGDYNKIGFDCSGLTLYAFAGVGISLPHYTGYQYQRGTQISPSEAQRGDLLFWGPAGNHHVAIYLGDGMMIEAPQSGDVVKKSPVRWSSMSQYAVRLI